jgi:carbonic anhydrase/acetyltransferase-like protein (isoleucine patch superfamily)
MLILSYNDHKPTIADSAFIAPNSTIIGNVIIGAESSIWFQCVIRADVQSITIGDCTNIQDGSVIHVTRVNGPTKIGSYVTIGHRALLHACTIEDYGFIGMGATLLDGVLVQKGGMVAAGSVVTSGKIIASGEIWAGNPARLLRLMRQEEIDFLAISAENYRRHCHEYRIICSQPGHEHNGI